MLHSLRGRGRKRERGQILVLFELFFILIIAFAALVIDLGVLRNNRQILVNTFDAAALAGGTMLPVTGSAEAATLKSMVDKNIQANYPGLPTSAYTVTYRCLIGIDANTGATLISQVPGVCDPTHAVGHTPTVNDFSGAGGTRVAPCNPTLGDKCNVVVIMGSSTTRYKLAPIVGVNSGSSGQVVSAACKGPCGANVDVPVDLVIILDRTGSMADGSDKTGAKIHSLRTAAETVLSVYNPAKQRVALALTGPGAVNSSGAATSGSCYDGGTGYGIPDDTNFSPSTTLTPSGTTTVSSLGSGTFLTTTLSQAISSTSSTTVRVTSAANFPTTGQYTIQVDNEQMRVTGGQGTTTWTVTRGYNTTTAATHTNGRPVGWAVGTTDTSIRMTSTAGFPASYPFTILVDTEQLSVTASPSANVWTVTRGVNSTTAARHGGVESVTQIYPIGGTTLRVASATGFPTSGQFTVNVGSEHMLVTGGQGTTTWTVTRAQDSTTATYYVGGETVTRVVGKSDTTIQVGAPHGPAFPSVPFTIAVESTGSTVDYEHMVVTAVSGSSAPYTWIVTRAQDSTPAATHNSGAIVDGVTPWVPNASNVGVWVPLGFSGTDTDVPLPVITGTAGTYSVGGAVQTTTPLYKSIECIWASTSGTNLSTPIKMAQWYLDHYGRPGVTQGIILETDGHPQVGFASGDQTGTNSAYTCQAALDAANAAKADTTNSPDGIQFFTIGYGVDSSSKCPTRTTSLTQSNSNYNMYETTTWSGRSATQVLAAMATDASHYFENPTSAELTSVFTQAAAMLLKGGPHLVQLYPAPIVTHASGPVTGVSITGKYFTGASSVRFGMTPATSFTVNSDSSITARIPASASGTIVDVTVTTPGGGSIVTPMDRYTYP
jgi:hypothetical protein